MQWPLVTVITLCYNTGPYVLQALECVKGQGYPNLQHIVIDDCSKDDSATQVQQWIDDHQYPCTFIRHQQNKGIAKTLQEAFSIAGGKYLTFISDDLWVENRLIPEVELFESLDDSYAMIYGDSRRIDQDNQVLTPSIFKELRGKDFVAPSGNIFSSVAFDFYFFIQASMIRRSHFEAMKNPFSKKIISEDWAWQLWLSRNYQVFGRNEVTALYRKLQSSVTQTHWTRERKHKVLRSHFRMIAPYYRHPKNTEAEKMVIFHRLLRVYEDICQLPNFSLRDEIALMAALFWYTGKRYALRRMLHILRRGKTPPGVPVFTT